MFRVSGSRVHGGHRGLDFLTSKHVFEGFRVKSLGFRVKGLGLRVKGLGGFSVNLRGFKPHLF